MVILIGAVVTAATGVKKQSRGQGLFLVLVKRSRTIFKLSNHGQDVYDLRVHIAYSVVKCVRSNGQGPICGAVKQSSNKNNGQNFLTPVAAVTTVPMGVTTPCSKTMRWAIVIVTCCRRMCASRSTGEPEVPIAIP